MADSIFTGSYSLTKNNNQLTIKYDNNNHFTITTNDDKYLIDSVTASFVAMGGFGSGTITNGVISTDKHTYTLTLQTTDDWSPSDYQSISFDVETKEQTIPVPTKSIFKGLYSLTQYKDRLKLNYDNNNTFTITTINDKYIINSVLARYNTMGGIGNGTITNGVISPDKHTYTLTLQTIDGWSPSDFQSVDFKVDVADTTPLNPTPENEHLTQRVYTVDENGLNDFVKQAVTMFKGSVTNYDYTNFVNQLYVLPFNLPAKLSDPVSKIITGMWSINTNAREFKDIYATVSCGTIKVIPENNNGFDKNIKSVTLYLPFIPALKLDIDDCYNKEIYTEYVINLMTGATTVNIYSDNKLLNTFNTDIKNNLQLFNIYNNHDVGKLSSTIKNNLRSACIKVVYYEPVKDLVSYETLEHNKLSSYTNFVKTRNSTVSCGTQQEQQEIESLLDNGIIINNLTKN